LYGDYVVTCVAGPQLNKLTGPDNLERLKDIMETTDAPEKGLIYFEALLAFLDLKKKTFGIQ